MEKGGGEGYGGGEVRDMEEGGNIEYRERLYIPCAYYTVFRSYMFTLGLYFAGHITQSRELPEPGGDVGHL